MLQSVRPLAGALAMSVLLCACAGTPVTPHAIPPLENQPAYPVERADLLEISPDMSRFVERTLESEDLGGGRAWSLAYATLDPYILEFEYDPQVTLAAADAFEQRTGNCLTFSNLFIAMARSAGMESWYREVEVLPEWSKVNDTMLVSMHVNAVVRDRGKEFVVDVSGREREHNERVRRLSDEEAEAQFYGNLGVDALIENDLPRAYAYFALALDVRPGLPYIWSNLGVVFRRNDQTEEAKLAYRTALEFDPDHAVSLNNLYVIYEEEGDMEAAEATYARVEKIRRRNPYYLHYLASLASEEQRHADAVGYMRRAIQIEDSEYRFHQRLAQSYYLLGQEEKAQASLERARRLAPSGLDTSTISLSDEPVLSDP